MTPLTLEDLPTLPPAALAYLTDDGYDTYWNYVGLVGDLRATNPDIEDEWASWNVLGFEHGTREELVAYVNSLEHLTEWRIIT